MSPKCSLMRIADGHSDLLYEVALRAGEEHPFRTHWLPHLQVGEVGLQVCAISVDTDQLPESGLRATLKQVAAAYRAVGEDSERVTLVRRRADLAPVRAGERIGLLLSMEGAEPLGYDPELCDIYWELGVRMFGLTWNRRNLLADGASEDEHGGLSRTGERVVQRLAQLGAILDLAHASRKTFADVLEQAPDAPVVVSHGACRALVDTPRNLDDQQLRALAARGGVLGVMAHPLAIDPERPTVERIVDHIDHAIDVMGLEHVGLGGDFVDQIIRSGLLRITASPDALLPPGVRLDTTIEELAGPQDYPRLVGALRARGYHGHPLEAILGGNLLGLLDRALPA